MESMVISTRNYYFNLKSVPLKEMLAKTQHPDVGHFPSSYLPTSTMWLSEEYI